jgi:hypothetical protein
MAKYRIFVRAGNHRGYSAVVDITSPNPRAAVAEADRRSPHWRGKHIALPHSRYAIWPDCISGLPTPRTLEYLRRTGQIPGVPRNEA